MLYTSKEDFEKRMVVEHELDKVWAQNNPGEDALSSV